MRIKEIKNLIKFVAKAGAKEVSIEMEKLKLTIKTADKTVVQQPAPVVQPPAISEPKRPAVAPPPEKQQDAVSEGSVLCVIEAMKLFNEIESEVSGKIVKVLVEDSTPVEFDQPLFLIDPS